MKILLIPALIALGVFMIPTLQCMGEFAAYAWKRIMGRT